MDAAVRYLEKSALFPSFISRKPADDLFLIVVIPCFNEPDLTGSLQSLYECDLPDSGTEVIVVLNEPVGCSPEIREQNNRTLVDFHRFASMHNSEKLHFSVIDVRGLPAKDAGVGLARKIGMDEAVRRFVTVGQSRGVIAGFDADCTCSPNYLNSIAGLFAGNDRCNACSIRFEHPILPGVYPQNIVDGIVQYELYLRYYVNALKGTGFPYAFQTIGSSFAVRAEVYARQGGMNKRKAGEDFYFLHKVIPLGNYSEINDAVVYPSPRPSDRVPFGTGAAIAKMLRNGDSEYLTYRPEAFEQLYLLFSVAGDFFRKTEPYTYYLAGSSSLISQYLRENDFESALDSCNRHSSSLSSFLKRFYTWFDAFRVLKFMNYCHPEYYSHIPVSEAASQWLKSTGRKNLPVSPDVLLNIFRKEYP